MIYLLAKFGSYRSYENGDINSYISSYLNTLEKAELITSVILRYFQNQGYRFTVRKSRTRLVEKPKEKKKRKNTGNCKVFTPTQKRSKEIR